MDQTLIDLTEGPDDLANGEVVTLIGEQSGNNSTGNPRPSWKNHPMGTYFVL